MEIFIPVLIVGAVALIAGVGLGIANHFFAVKGDERAEAIQKELPGANCGACGYSGCSGYAAALSSDPSVKTNLCVVGGDAVAEKIASILGLDAEKTERRVAEVMCRGTEDCTSRRFAYNGIASCKAQAQLYGGGGACRFGCLGCGDCAAACEFGAIAVCRGVAVVDAALCKGCGQCVSACPKGIITLVLARPHAEVFCSNTDKAAATKAVCSAGCLGCKMCAKVCPSDAITFDGGRAVISAEKCVSCGKCAEACKFGVIVTVRE